MKRYLLCIVLVGMVMWLAGCNDVVAQEVEQEVMVSGESKAEKEESKAAAPDPEGVVVTVDGVSLTNKQVDYMLKHRIGRGSRLNAINFWIELQVRQTEAKRRDLHKTEEAEFILELYQDNYLARQFLGDAIKSEAPPATEEEARAEYEKTIERYKQPKMVSVQQIEVKDEETCRKVLAAAEEPGSDIKKLYDEYTPNPNRMKGRILKADVRRLTSALGAESVPAVMDAQEGALLGPLKTKNGFSVIKIEEVTEAFTQPFDEVKDRILGVLNTQKGNEYLAKYFEELKEKVKIVKSPELEELESQGPAEGPRPGGPPARMNPDNPRRPVPMPGGRGGSEAGSKGP
ncbi:MAG: peptidyl-prolyl cis-trans isomerase [Sedimentisphaerales bacterium]|nr:peptidyl-prolyl cis-trans isomerase [Sedimentisphaerales bacterium]